MVATLRATEPGLPTLSETLSMVVPDHPKLESTSAEQKKRIKDMPNIIQGDETKSDQLRRKDVVALSRRNPVQTPGTRSATQVRTVEGSLVGRHGSVYEAYWLYVIVTD